MWIIIEVIVFVAKLAYHWAVSMLMAFVPTSLIAKDISGKTVLITGAGGGVGRLLAERFAEKGCRLVLWDVNEKLNKQTLDSAQTNYAAHAVAYTVDLSDREAIYKTADKVRNEFGPVDILVNNAGVVFGKYVMDADDRQMVKTMEVNCFAHYWTCKAFLPNMIKNNYGHLVSLASSAGLMGVPGMADYCASKFASVGFEESLRMELAQRGITSVKTTVVCPFLIDTGMFEGCKMRFPLIMKGLDPNYVARSVVDAVLRDKEVVFLPRFIYLTFFCKAILPVKCQTLVHEFFGTTTFMNHFVGHQKQQ
ncbi:hypothetical protein Btru_009673 [Bulinus truncatus]|nr:hypothetical protein Btru_009673 [Bulinus truncatus]